MKTLRRYLYITEYDYCKKFRAQARRHYDKSWFETVTKAQLEQTVVADILRGRTFEINTFTNANTQSLLGRLYMYHPMYTDYHETRAARWQDDLLLIYHVRSNAVESPLGIATVEYTRSAV